MKPDSPILTIAIPTYNRAAKLQAQLERLVPQSTPEVQICVFDNASPDSTQLVVAKYVSQGVVYFRANTNCGGGRNIFRCLEECHTEWLWILSDDDLITTTAVSDLLAILRIESCDFIHTSFHDRPYLGNKVVSDFPALFQQSKSLGDLLWITAGIYRINSFRPLFWLYNEGMSTCGPHLLMVLSLLETHGGKVLLTPVTLTIPKPVFNSSWSTLDVLMRLSQAPEYLTRIENQQSFADRIFLDFFDGLMLMGLRETIGNEKVRRWQRIYSQVCFNLKAYHAGGMGSYLLKNWYKAGRRKTSLRMAMVAIQLKLLSWCPVSLFHFLIRLLPLPKGIRNDFYDKRQAYVPSH